MCVSSKRDDALGTLGSLVFILSFPAPPLPSGLVGQVHGPGVPVHGASHLSLGDHFTVLFRALTWGKGDLSDPPPGLP